MGTLERPSALSVGLNTVEVLISDNVGNVSNFSYSFDVSLTVPTAPNFGFFSVDQPRTTTLSLQVWLAGADSHYDDLNYDGQVDRADYDLAFLPVVKPPSSKPIVVETPSLDDG